MIRKAALVGCQQGPWISLAGMTNPHLRASLQPDTRIQVEHLNGKAMDTLSFTGSGEYQLLAGADFARVSVAEGDCESVLCDIISRRPDYVPA